jgi:D-glycero-D-manno-heptose 1,7-bisphosphate phosphatase
MQPRALFLDRDGTLTRDLGYTFRVDDLFWLPGARETIAAANKAGWCVVLVTNQSGIGRGLYSQSDMHAFHAAMQQDLHAISARIDAIYFCPFVDDALDPSFRVANHPDRKPNPGMFLRAIADLNLDPTRSLAVGDSERDSIAATRAGIPALRTDGGDLLSLVGPHLQ